MKRYPEVVTDGKASKRLVIVPESTRDCKRACRRAAALHRQAADYIDFVTAMATLADLSHFPL
ncbi:MAG TPA: hypothetical protein PK201_10390, partial [Accumulibacter sp.]|nr:hypothetical protein [Accumulibacter sp.]